jgi:hypothetical protein
LFGVQVPLRFHVQEKDRMIEPRDTRSPGEKSSDEVKQDWQAPALTLLGDARTLTESGGALLPDGAGSSALS